MKPDRDPPYLISRIRLINFHNFIDETITLPEGGHLFLLGDNGCGKTTILDAVHYVLTAGLAMEWNSAARMAGARRDGRRVQGVVLRYNVDTGVMNQGGAITYAALEIIGRHGRPLTVGVGLSATAMDERIRQWGVIRECPLEEIAFLTEEEGRPRPLSRREFMEHLGARRGFYKNISNFRQEIAGRLFGGWEAYQEICRFLTMGKAYREIAAGAADYHELFKRLLPEPRTGIFEQIIEALRTLDEAQAILDDLDRKLAWLNELDNLAGVIAEGREGICRYDWLLCRFRLEANGREQERLDREIERACRRLDERRADIEKMRRAGRELHNRLADLKAKDASGLVRQEKSCRALLAEKKADLTVKAAELKEKKARLRKAQKGLDRDRRALGKHLGAMLPELARRAGGLPFSIAALLGEVDRISRREDSAADALRLDGREALRACRDHLREVELQAALLGREEETLAGEITGLEEHLQDLRGRTEVWPDLAGFQECLRDLGRKMLSPRPLYLGLEWQATVGRQERDRVEEFIGEDILGILLLSETEYAMARETVPDWPGIRISIAGRGPEDLPDWIRACFDLSTSDPDALRCLATEMETSQAEPQVATVGTRQVVAFRSHERALHGAASRLIGSESRCRALKEEIAGCENRLRELEKGLRKLRKRQRQLAEQRDRLTAFDSFLQTGISTVHDLAGLVVTAQQEADHCQELYDQQERLAASLEQEVETLGRRGRELAELIAGKGLAGLDRRIGRVEQEWGRNQDALAALQEESGGIKEEIDRYRQQLDALGHEQRQLEEQAAAHGARLRELLPGLEDVAHHVLKTRKGQQFKSSDAIRRERESCRQRAISHVERLKLKLNDPEFGGAFRFSYEEETNQLVDFRGRSLPDVLAEQTGAVNEQKEIISDRTRELFKKIIMTDLMNYLRGHVSELDRMIRRINSLLKDRSFGGQRYCFRIRPQERFRQLLTVVKKFSPFDPAAEKELRNFFEDHRDEIVATEVGAIPEELDYRNWYRYEMEVSTVGDTGVVMDRRTKSVGSGGEQAVPNYLLILTIAHFLYRGKKVRLHILLFDEAFYGIDAGRRDQILGFATDIGLQLFIASPDQDGVRTEISRSTTLLVKKDGNFDVHLYPFHWRNPADDRQIEMFAGPAEEKPVAFGEEL